MYVSIGVYKSSLFLHQNNTTALQCTALPASETSAAAAPSECMPAGLCASRLLLKGSLWHNVAEDCAAVVSELLAPEAELLLR